MPVAAAAFPVTSSTSKAWSVPVLSPFSSSLRRPVSLSVAIVAVTPVFAALIASLILVSAWSFVSSSARLTDTFVVVSPTENVDNCGNAKKM
jgi:hypothetical protein